MALKTVYLKRSAVQGKVPTTSSLGLGEIAINTYDGRLFIKKDDGTQSILEVGVKENLKITQYVYDFDATSNQTDFVVSGKVFSNAECQVFTEGIKDRPNTYTVTDNGTDTTISFTNGKNPNDWVEIIIFGVE